MLVGGFAMYREGDNLIFCVPTIAAGRLGAHRKARHRLLSNARAYIPIPAANCVLIYLYILYYALGRDRERESFAFLSSRDLEELLYRASSALRILRSLSSGTLLRIYTYICNMYIRIQLMGGTRANDFNASSSYQRLDTLYRLSARRICSGGNSLPH